MIRMKAPAEAAPEPEAVRLTQEQVEALDAIIERLIAFRDSIDGDTEMEDDNQDRCEAWDDCIVTNATWNGLPHPGDPVDAEDDDPAEDNDDAENESWANPREGSGERAPRARWQAADNAAGWPPEKKAAYWEEQDFNRRQSVVCKLLRQPAQDGGA